jgi:tRNA pseudouridine38-40 synthase
MQEAASQLVGTHDFGALGTPPQGENTVRTVMQSAWTREERPGAKLLVYEIEADAFLNHMVRRIVGLSVTVGRKEITLTQFAEIITSADLMRVKTIAPPEGLVLEKVRYPGEEDKSTLPQKRFLF